MAFRGRGRLPPVTISAPQPDSARIKDEMSKTAKGLQWGAPNAQAQLDTYVAKNDTLRAIRKGAPSGTHKSFAEGVDAFDGAACTSESAPKPPTASIPRGHSTPDRLPKAVGHPPLALQADGTDNLRSNYATLDANDARPESSTGRGPTPPDHFNDSCV